jgi:signal recognition particle receptor subunit beta
VVEIDRSERVVRVKIIYYGPAAGGKTTNLLVLHRSADPERRGEMVSVNSSQDRTILLDLLPLRTPAFRGYDLRLQLLAVPGQSMYAASRKLLLNGADGLVFVANSAADRWQETLSSLREMNENLISHGLDPTGIPLVLQYNKRDLPETTPLEAMDRTLNVRGLDSFPAIAIREEGVVETFGGILHCTLADVTQRYQIGEELRDARSVQEWTEETTKVIFGWSLSSGKPESASRVTVRSLHKLPNLLHLRPPLTRTTPPPQKLSWRAMPKRRLI